MENTYEDLMARYPLTYRQNKLSMQETCMCWGIDCGIGWYSIIDELSNKVEALNQQIASQARLRKIPVFVEFTQVKEKFATLRIYFSAPSNETYDLVTQWINEAEDKSAKTCETCGNPGHWTNYGWHRTMCDTCEDAFILERNAEYIKYNLKDPKYPMRPLVKIDWTKESSEDDA